MPRIAFLVSADTGKAVNDNHQRLPRAFASAGWEVERIDHGALAVASNRLAARTVDGKTTPLAGFDRYWMLGFGPRTTFLDRMQLLRGLDQNRFVNSTDAFVYLHGKATLLFACAGVPQPVTHMSNDAEALFAVLRQGGDWIAKPPAGSFGRGVFRLRAGDINAWAVLEHLTGDGAHAILQQHMQPGEGGEKRALIVAGQVVGAYGKVPADHRGNIRAGAGARPATLDEREWAILKSLASRLAALGVRFAAVDLLAHCVLEINIVNPGWLGTYESIHGVDLAPKVASLVAGYEPTSTADALFHSATALSRRSGSEDCD